MWARNWFLSSFFFVLGCHGDVKNPVVCDGGYFFYFSRIVFIYLSCLVFFLPPVFLVEAVPALSLGS